jgi:Domain of unknown function (DUF1844)
MFTPDGQLRPDFQPEEPSPPPKEAPAPGAAPPSPPTSGPRAPESPGAAPGSERATSPMTGERLPRREPSAARQMIDWLGALESKTRGNLSFEESSLLANVLAELRLAYVEATRPPGREPPR